mmetsp:Transcript_31549/g.67850  ORF Transcript_31549/g.67850 Transcript_31549/m.67850 type:complete len:230 (+) Transcript_31549:97-786(+)
MTADGQLFNYSTLLSASLRVNTSRPSASFASVINLLTSSGSRFAALSKFATSCASFGNAPASNCCFSQRASLVLSLSATCRASLADGFRRLITHRRKDTVGSPRRICSCSRLMSARAIFRNRVVSACARGASFGSERLKRLSTTASNMSISQSTSLRSASASPRACRVRASLELCAACCKPRPSSRCTAVASSSPRRCESSTSSCTPRLVEMAVLNCGANGGSISSSCS